MAVKGILPAKTGPLEGVVDTGIVVMASVMPLPSSRRAAGGGYLLDSAYPLRLRVRFLADDYAKSPKERFG